MRIIITKGGLGLGSLTSLVTLAFVIAKLTGAIDWSWLVVFSPVLAYVALGVVITICVLLVLGIGLLVGYSKLKKLVKGREFDKIPRASISSLIPEVHRL
jgi:uncharacterized membrane protein YdbT with pleckstrin-like domain